MVKGSRMNVSWALIGESLKCHFKEFGIYCVDKTVGSHRKKVRTSRDMICVLNLFHKEKSLWAVKR